MEITTRMSRHQLVARSAAAGSMVLLKNLHNTLPFVQEHDRPLPVAVFGVGQLLTCLYHGITPWGNGSILGGLSANSNILPDSLLVRKYRNHLDITQEELPIHSLSLEEFAQENQAAIVVITRSPDGYDTNLTALEKSMVKAVGSTFDRCVLILNTPGYMELEDVAEHVSALVYMGIPGQEGGHALADLLTGNTVFSGRLANTWPVAVAQNTHYVGYCHYDSMNEDVRYPFGYGLYYGACAMDHYAVALDQGKLVVDATFTNTSEAFPCRELAQVYVSTPTQNAPVYTLEAFAKTPLLQPGDSATVSMAFPVEQLATFDPAQEAMVLKKGYYDIRLGTNSRTTFVAGSIFVPKDGVVSKATGPSLAQPAVTAPYTYGEEAQELATARAKAIRLPMRMKPTASRRWKPRNELAPLALGLTYGNTTDYTSLIAQLSMEQLETLLNGSPVVEFAIPAMTEVGGIGGLNLAKYLRNDKGEVYARRYLTAFPVPQLLACSFDQELLSSVGQAMGCEAKEFGCHLYTDLSANLADWSEDPVVTGHCVAWFLQGMQSFTAAALHGGLVGKDAISDHRTFWKSYEIAIRLGKPMVYNGLLPMELLQGNWGFKGAHYDWDDKATAQQAALSLVKLMATLNIPGTYQ